MDIKACTVLILSWVLCSIPDIDCYSTGRGAASECFLESILRTERKTTGVEIEVINWNRMKVNLMKILLLYKKMDYIYLNNSVIVDSNRAYCDCMSLGFKIENIEHTKNTAKALLGQIEHQLLTDVIRLYNMSLVTSKHHRVFLNDQKMSLVLKNLGIKTRFNKKELKHNLHYLSLKDIFLTYTDKDMALLCKANYFMKIHHKKMEMFKNQWEKSRTRGYKTPVLVKGTV